MLSVLENFVVAVAGIPRQGGLSTSASNFAVPPPASSPIMSGPSVVPTTQLMEESVQAACEVRYGKAWTQAFNFWYIAM